MMLLEIEKVLSDEEQAAQQTGLTVKCGWCGEIIRMDGDEPALAMCQTCYKGMLEEFLRAQQTNNPTDHHSDR